MVGQTDRPTAEEQRRLDILADIEFCLPCLIDGWTEAGEIHHVVEGRVRLGHRWTYLNCPWHHRGKPPTELTFDFGPSLARSSTKYAQRYGTERQLVQMQDALVRISEQAARRHEYIADIKLISLSRQLHKEIVLGVSPMQ